MTEKTIRINNRAGIHARPAAMFVEAAKEFKCTIHVEKGRDKINGKSILGLMTLGASYGMNLKIITDGEDEERAAEILVRLIESKFEEE